MLRFSKLYSFFINLSFALKTPIVSTLLFNIHAVGTYLHPHNISFYIILTINTFFHFVIQTLVLMNVLKTFQALLAFGGWITFFYFFCNMAEEVESRFEGIGNAVYQCEWFDMPPNFRKSFIIIMKISRNPVFYHGVNQRFNRKLFSKVRNEHFFRKFVKFFMQYVLTICFVQIWLISRCCAQYLRHSFFLVKITDFKENSIHSNNDNQMTRLRWNYIYCWTNFAARWMFNIRSLRHQAIVWINSTPLLHLCTNFDVFETEWITPFQQWDNYCMCNQYGTTCVIDYVCVFNKNEFEKREMCFMNWWHSQIFGEHYMITSLYLQIMTL